jgi:ArsR family transcriptional regulator, virulence genes transcriptional regulator
MTNRRQLASTGARGMAELQENAVHVTALLKAIANPARLVILCELIEGERSVGALERAVGLSQSAISQHLAVLRRGDVVASRRNGQTVFYSLASAEVVTLMGTLHDVFCRDKRSPRTASLARATV